MWKWGFRIWQSVGMFTRATPVLAFSFYDQVVGPDVTRKSSSRAPRGGQIEFHAKIADHFSGLGVDIEEHGCSDPFIRRCSHR